MTAEELREWLHIEPGELKTTAHLRQRAIDYPRADLDKKSPLTFTYTSKKEGRRVIGWTFTVKENKPKSAAGKAKARRVPSTPAPAAERLTPERITELKREVRHKAAAVK